MERTAYMRLYHATPIKNLASIQAKGLDPNLATGKEKLIWLHTASRKLWALQHTAKRHKCDITEVAIIGIDVPRSKLRKRSRGIWTTAETITQFRFLPKE